MGRKKRGPVKKPLRGRSSFQGKKSHPEVGVLSEYAQGEVNDKIAKKVVSHIKRCGDCRQIVYCVKNTQWIIKLTSDTQKHPHLNVLIHYHRGEFGPQTRRRVALHMLTCRLCAGIHADLEERYNLENPPSDE